MIGSHLEPELAVVLPARSVVVILMSEDMSLLDVKCQKSNVKSKSGDAGGFSSLRSALGFGGFLGGDSHAVEGSMDEERADEEEGDREDRPPHGERSVFHL